MQFGLREVVDAKHAKPFRMLATLANEDWSQTRSLQNRNQKRTVILVVTRDWHPGGEGEVSQEI